MPATASSVPDLLWHHLHLLVIIAAATDNVAIVVIRLLLVRIPPVLRVLMPAITVHDRSTAARVRRQTVVYFVLSQHHLASLDPLLNDLAMHVNEYKAQILLKQRALAQGKGQKKVRMFWSKSKT